MITDTATGLLAEREVKGYRPIIKAQTQLAVEWTPCQLGGVVAKVLSFIFLLGIRRDPHRGPMFLAKACT